LDRKNCSYVDHQKSNFPNKFPAATGLSFFDINQIPTEEIPKFHQPLKVALNQRLRSTDFNCFQTISTRFNMIRRRLPRKTARSNIRWAYERN